jgi:hypothetical protein
MTLCAGFSTNAPADDFVNDSKASIESRTMYFNRDFRDGSTTNPQGASKRDEAAQGFILNFQSGYTAGLFGFGVDALGMAGFQLDSSPSRSGTGLLPSSGSDPRGAQDQYAKFGVAAKIRVAKTALKYGAMMPDVPMLKYNDGRLLPTMFNGGMLTSEDVHNFKFMASRLNHYTARDSTDSQDIRLNCKNKRYICDTTGNHFDMYGVDYKLSPNVTLQYHYATLENVYQQQFFGLVGSEKVGPGVASSDVRLFKSDDAGSAHANSIDNKAFSTMFGYAVSGHKLSVGWQTMIGDTSMPYLDGTNPYLVNYIQVNDFAAAQERSWQARYDYDFKAVGLSGLTFMTRYVNGDNIKVTGSEAEGKEWERDSELKYVAQTGTFKDLSLRVRNATFRNNYERFARDVDETRLILSYNFTAL